MIDLRNTIIPKSDQTNADDLLSGPKTIRISKVSLCAEPDQPIAISFEGDNGKPYKPCKSMRRLLVQVWGSDGAEFVGRSMTLYQDPKVKFGGAEVGGIRISHMSHIDKPVTVALTVTKSVRKPYRVSPLATDASEPTVALEDVLSAIASAETTQELDATKPLIRALSGEDRAAAIEAGKVRRAAIDGAPDNVAEILAGIAKHDPSDLDIWLEEAREQGLSPEDVARVEAAIAARKS